MGFSPDAITGDVSDLWGDIKGTENKQLNQLRRFERRDPLARSITQGALEYQREGDSPLLTSLTDWAQDTVENRGRLTPQLLRENTQGSRAWAGMGGTGFTNQAFANELLNRDKYVEERAKAAQNFGMGVEQLGERAEESRANVGQGALNTVSSAFSRTVNPIIAAVTDLFTTNLNAQNAAEIGESNKNTALLGSGIESIGNVIGGVAGMSDERLKVAIRDTGETTPEGIPRKRFRYRGDKTKQEYEGVMAQDVAKKVPSAVIPTLTGHLLVDFSQLAEPMYKIKRVKGRTIKAPLLMEV